MYIRLVHHYPSSDKTQELSTLVQDYAKAQNAKGAPCAVLTPMLGSEPDIVHAVVHEDFGAWQAHMAKNAADSDFQVYAGKMLKLVDRFPVQELNEVVAIERSSTPSAFLWTNTFRPLPGSGPELRKLLEERLSTSLKRGSVSANLMQRLYGPDGPAFSLTIGFADLAGLETYTKAMQGDAATQKWGEALSKTVAGPQTPMLSRVLVALPPQA